MGLEALAPAAREQAAAALGRQKPMDRGEDTAGEPAEPGDRPFTDDLVEQLYAVTVDPDRYDDLMAVWGRHIQAFAEAQSDAPGALVYSSEVERHFARALAILERIGRPETDDPEALVLADPRPALLVQRDGRVAVANDAAAAQLGAKAGAALSDIAFDSDALPALTKALGRLAASPDGAIVCVAGAHAAGDGRRIVLGLTKADSGSRSPLMGKLIAIDVGWDPEAARQIAGAFGLSPAETEIAHAYVAGTSLADLASSRRRSLATVRTQAKSLLRKLGLHSQLELIRLFAGYSMLRGPGAPAIAHAAGFRTATLALPGGRSLHYGELGAADGRPVILLHGMLTGIRMTDAAQAAFAGRGLRVIAPWRPGFAASTPDPGPVATAPQRFAADIAALMDRLDLGPCPLIGHMSGSIFAFAAAAALPRRITALMNVSGVVPLKSVRQIAFMTPRQRIVAYTAKFAPRIFPAIVRAGIAQMDHGGMARFIEALYRNAPADLRVTQDPEVFSIMDEAYRETVAQGSRGFEIDGLLSTKDWTAAGEACPMPVTLLHGAHDPAVHISTVRAFAARHPAIRLHEFPDRGHLLMHTDPAAIADHLVCLMGNAG